MFTELYPLVKASKKITLVLSPAVDNRLKVVVIPPVDSQNEKALAHPLSMVETPEVLDREFAVAIRDFHEARESLQEQLAATKVILEQKKSESLNKATKALETSNAICEENRPDKPAEDSKKKAASEPADDLVLGDLF